jgi:pre-mRNA-splicing factor SPF27
MPLINESYDSLPYLDAPPTDSTIADVRNLIESEIRSAGIDTSQLHPALIPAASYTPKFSDALEQEHARLEADRNSKLSAIDLTRYEALEAPPNTNPTSDEDKPELLRQWNETLRKAYTSSEYLNARLTQLGLLEKFGKNAWLIGNSQLEDILKALERELADLRVQQEDVETARRTQQESVRGEMAMLEETWKKSVSRVLETEVAVEGLKQQILERRRAGAV